MKFDKSQSKISLWRKFFYSDRAAGNDKISTFKAIEKYRYGLFKKLRISQIKDMIN